MPVNAALMEERVKRWFTSADANVPAEQYASYIERHKRWNFTVNALDITFFNLGMSFIYSTTVLSLYTSYLTTSAVLIGLIPAIQSVSFFWPQLITARHIQRLPRKRPFMVKFGLLERLPYLFIALVALLWPGAPSSFAYGVLAISLLLASTCGGLGAPAWQSMVAKVVPVTLRGRMFGLSSALGGLLGLGGAALSRQILAQLPFPTSFGYCFLLCFVSLMISYLGVLLNREPPRESPELAPTAAAYWRSLPALLRQNPNLMRFLVARALMILGGMAATFYVIYGRARFGISDQFAATLTIVALASQTVGTPLMGLLADRSGNKALLELGGVCAALSALLGLLMPSADWLYGIFVLLNLANATNMIAGQSIPMEFGTPETLPVITALISTSLALPLLLAPIIGGWLADVAGYRALFSIALGVMLCGLALMRLGVRDPRHLPPMPSAMVESSAGSSAERASVQ